MGELVNFVGSIAIFGDLDNQSGELGIHNFALFPTLSLLIPSVEEFVYSIRRWIDIWLLNIQCLVYELQIDKICRISWNGGQFSHIN